MSEKKKPPKTFAAPAEEKGLTMSISAGAPEHNESIMTTSSASSRRPDVIKRTKSRTGCRTCKKKRLKCDERKPTCEQCERRKVKCEGYARDFKWKSFEGDHGSFELTSITTPDNFNLGSSSMSRTAAPISSQSLTQSSISPTSPTFVTSISPIASTFGNTVQPKSSDGVDIDGRQRTSKRGRSSISGPTQSVAPTPSAKPSRVTSTGKRSSIGTAVLQAASSDADSMDVDEDVEQGGNYTSDEEELPSHTKGLLSGLRREIDIDELDRWGPNQSSSLRSVQDDNASSLGSRHPIGAYQATKPKEAKKDQMPLLFDDSGSWQTYIRRQGEIEAKRLRTVEDVISFAYGADSGDESGSETLPQRVASAAAQPGSGSDTPMKSTTRPLRSKDTGGVIDHDLAASPETPNFHEWSKAIRGDDQGQMLKSFMNQTCRVLSILDDDSLDNPWKAMIVPMIPSSAPLYHATAAMTSFQILKDPQRAMDHMNKCVDYLGRGYSNMTYEAAIATHLCMAFAESWNPLSPNSGHTHVQAARHLIRAAFDIKNTPDGRFDEPLRNSKVLRFLCKTFVYLDVLLRLTSVFNSDANDFEAIMASVMAQAREETYLDPLMGCASTLFPVLGHVANLVQRACQASSTSPEALRQAIALRIQLETWQPPSQVLKQASVSSGVRDCLALAEAYKNATLLHLQQGIPELPTRNPTNDELAKRTLRHLSQVTVSSKATFVQIYPMLVAGSEAESQERRQWVRTRLRDVSIAMPVGCILASCRVAEEVWKRRDRARDDNNTTKGVLAPQRKDKGSGKDLGSPSAYMARGELHWLRVLADWNWQVLLG